MANFDRAREHRAQRLDTPDSRDLASPREVGRAEPAQAAPGRWIGGGEPEPTERTLADRRFLELTERRRGPNGETGVFARDRIAAGTVLVYRWHDGYYVGMVGWIALSLDEIERLPPRVHQLFRRYGLDADFGKIYGPMSEEYVTTLDNFINHACSPNLGYDEAGNVVPLRDLAAGEELRIDYGSFVVNHDETFECGCGSDSCRGRITRDDWQALAARGDVRLPPFVRRRAAVTSRGGASPESRGQSSC